MRVSDGTESSRNLRSDIEVSDAQVDEVGKGFKRLESAGAVLDPAHDAVEAFGGGVGQVCPDEGGDAGGVLAHLVDGFVEGFDDVEAVQDELGVGAVLADGADEGLAQVATGPADPLLLVVAEMVPEKASMVFRALPWPTHTTRERFRS